jgi:hypothetical protein
MQLQLENFNAFREHGLLQTKTQLTALAHLHLGHHAGYRRTGHMKDMDVRRMLRAKMEQQITTSVDNLISVLTYGTD